MRAIILLPVILGVITVLQGGLNKHINAQWGLASVVLLNSLIVLAGALIYMAVAYTAPHLMPSGLGASGGLGDIKLWWLIPGLCGLAIIALMPLAIARMGALNVFVLVVAAQMATSLLWDWVVEGVPPNPLRVGGAALAVVGVVLASMG